MEPSPRHARRSACGNEHAIRRGSIPSCCPRTLVPSAGRRGDSREWQRMPARSPSRCVPGAAFRSRRAPHMARWHRSTLRHGPLAFPSDACRHPRHLGDLSSRMPSAIRARRVCTREQVPTVARAAWRGGGHAGASASHGYPQHRPLALATITMLRAHANAPGFRVRFPLGRLANV
jgi:hypothetical protein